MPQLEDLVKYARMTKTTLKQIKTCRSGAKASVALALAFTFVSSAIRADDIVEVVRVDAPTNDVASVELPFVPFGGGL